MSVEERSAAEAAGRARALAEQALHAQAEGNTAEADRLLSQAQQLDPDAVAIVLNEHDAAVAPDARDTPTAIQDAERIRRIEPDINPAAYPGSIGGTDRTSKSVPEAITKLRPASPDHPLAESDQIHETSVYKLGPSQRVTAAYSEGPGMTYIPFPLMKRPLVAILRGLRPEEAESIVGALIECGFTAIEIPLNSPDPFRSIEIAVKIAPADTLIGAGTVLTLEAVHQLHNLGARLLVTPNVDPEIIVRAREKGMVTMPGVFTPSEALLAAKAGASGLKFFPAVVLGPAGITAIRAVLPLDRPIAAVGGISEQNFADYIKAGIYAFGLGSSLYKPGMTAAEVAERAKVTIHAYDLTIQGIEERSDDDH